MIKVTLPVDEKAPSFFSQAVTAALRAAGVEPLPEDVKMLNVRTSTGMLAYCQEDGLHVFKFAHNTEVLNGERKLRLDKQIGDVKVYTTAALPQAEFEDSEL